MRGPVPAGTGQAACNLAVLSEIDTLADKGYFILSYRESNRAMRPFPRWPIEIFGRAGRPIDAAHELMRGFHFCFAALHAAIAAGGATTATTHRDDT